MTDEPSWLCSDPACKGCNWWRENQKKIAAKAAEKEKRKAASCGPGNLDAARVIAESHENGRQPLTKRG